MTGTIPSRQALRYLSRLCATENQVAFSTLRGTRLCTQLKTPRTAVSSPHNARRTFTSLGRHHEQQASQSADNTTNTNTISPSSIPLPDITSYYTLFPQTIPNGPPPTGPFEIPVPQLRKEFLSLQALYHPDKYTTSPVAHQKAAALSALINSAYKTLSDPLLRAQYLLLQRYEVDVMSEDNSSHPTDQATLMDVMDAQERIEEAEGQEEIDEMKEENTVRTKETEAKLAKAFQEDDSKTATTECVRLKYWRSIAEGLHDWEPGKEVRLVH